MQLVEGEELVMKEQVGHPEWFTRSRLRRLGARA